MNTMNNIIDTTEKKSVLPEQLGFGTLFTEHVFEMDYHPGKGWHNPSIKKLEKINLHPAAMIFHYGQAVFEGMKAFKTVNDDVAFFRPQEHFLRLNRSAKRMCIPEIDLEQALESLKELVSKDKEWIPSKKGTALYIRPFIMATDEFLGVRPSSRYKFIILLSPVGAYYPEGFKPVKIYAQNEFVRAVRRGIGDCKTPGNYAASLFASEEAKKMGYTQVLWLDAIEQKFIEEVGTMNIFIRFENEIATPNLTGAILPGITRSSVIHLLKNKGENITERLIDIQEVIDAYKNKTLLEVFGTGTAAVISSVGVLGYKDKKMILNEGEAGKFAASLYDEITGIQYGEKPDVFNWLTYL